MQQVVPTQTALLVAAALIGRQQGIEELSDVLRESRCHVRDSNRHGRHIIHKSKILVVYPSIYMVVKEMRASYLTTNQADNTVASNRYQSPWQLRTPRPELVHLPPAATPGQTVRRREVVETGDAAAETHTLRRSFGQISSAEHIASLTKKIRTPTVQPGTQGSYANNKANGSSLRGLQSILMHSTLTLQDSCRFCRHCRPTSLAMNGVTQPLDDDDMAVSYFAPSHYT